MLNQNQKTMRAWGALLGVGMLLVAEPSFAAMPWEGPLCMVATSLSGPVAKSVAVIAIVVSGLLLALGELSGIFKTMIGLLMGVTMAVMAVQWLGILSPGSGGLSGCTGY